MLDIGMPWLRWDCRLNLRISRQFNLNKDKFRLTSMHICSQEVMTLQVAENSTASRKQLTGGAIAGQRHPSVVGLSSAWG